MRWGGANKPGAVERAFELARSGTCSSIKEIRTRLGAEGYSAAQIDGPSLIKQLRSVLRDAKGGGEL